MLVLSSLTPAPLAEIDRNVHHRAREFGMDKKVIPGDGVVCGFGEINGSVVYVFSRSRSSWRISCEAHAQKIVKLMDLAGRLVAQWSVSMIPVVHGSKRVLKRSRIRRNLSSKRCLLGVVPQISLLMGLVLAGQFTSALTDFVVMVDKKSYMFVTGPKVVQAVSQRGDTGDMEVGFIPRRAGSALSSWK